MGAYEEVNLQIPTPTKLPIGNLERHRHLVISVQHLVKAFFSVCAQLDVVCSDDTDPSQYSDQDGREKQPHGDKNLLTGLLQLTDLVLIRDRWLRFSFEKKTWCWATLHAVNYHKLASLSSCDD